MHLYVSLDALTLVSVQYDYYYNTYLPTESQTCNQNFLLMTVNEFGYNRKNLKKILYSSSSDFILYYS